MMDLSMATCNAEKAQMKSSEYRKVIKPLLERRRRARINSCLDELKALILESAQNENTDASKLEKADILELTVQHLRTLRRQSRSNPASPSPIQQQQSPSTPDKFRSGFAECAHEVSSFISAQGGVETHVKSRLITHLAHCINRIPTTPSTPNTPTSISASTTMINPAAQRQYTSTPTGHQYSQSGMTLTTPTPPPSPVSPYRQCDSPTTTAYAVPVSPISPMAASPNAAYHTKFMGSDNLYASAALRGEVYVWPDIPSSTTGRKLMSPVSDTQYSDDCSSYQREVSSPASSYRSSSTSSYRSQKDLEIDFHLHHDENSKPWRPW